VHGGGGERIGTVGIAHRVEESAWADDVGEWDPHVRQLICRNAVQRREGTGPQAHADGLVARFEPGDQHRAQRADDLAVDDVHAAVGRDAQRRGAHAAQMPEGLDPGSEVRAGARSVYPTSAPPRKITRGLGGEVTDTPGFDGRRVRFFQGAPARRA
jgi:hypothetical protein